MDDVQQETAPQKSNLNPLLFVVILIIIAAVGVMLWLGDSKNKQQTVEMQTQTKQEQEIATPTQPATGEAMEKTISVEGGNFYFKPNEIRVKKGEKVTITLRGVGMMHDFVIDELGVKSDQVKNGETTTVSFTPDKTGTFEFYCSVGSHRQMGMKGTLIVE